MSSTSCETTVAPPHPRVLGWFGTTALAMGGSNQMIFLITALFVGQGVILGQGSAAVPLLIIKNGLRIVTLSLLTLYVDPGTLTGSLHRQGGVAFFLLTMALLAPVLWFLQNSERRRASGEN